MIRISQIKTKPVFNEGEIKKALIRKLGIKEERLLDFCVVKKSVDARDKDNILFVYSVDAEIKNEKQILDRFSKDRNINKSEPFEYKLPEKGTTALKGRICVVGSGPAGMFCAYLLSKCGFRPVLIEQGENVDERQKSVESFWNGGRLNVNSNIQFGEGGAGTFSDGKLSTGVKDPSGRKDFVLKTFADHGAGSRIITDAKPHMGTDVLKKVIKSIRMEIIRNGGSVLFNTKFTAFHCDDEKLYEIEIEKDGSKELIECSTLVLAAGHSSRDTYKMLYENGVKMEPKGFAVGVRIEHSQEDINTSQYGKAYKEKYGSLLPPADYSLAAKLDDGHNVYSFCMCPGGYVVNSSSEEGRLCINGMSYSGRNGTNANSAIVVSISPDDVGADMDLFAGLEFQKKLEEKAFQAADGKIPTQRFGDFEAGKTTTAESTITSAKKGDTGFADLNNILPDLICRDVKEGIKRFGKIIEGFDSPDALVSAVESRTSSPLRITRDDHFESNIKGIFPCGEGAGYAGGITSAAIDGIKVFEEIYRRYDPVLSSET